MDGLRSARGHRIQAASRNINWRAQFPDGEIAVSSADLIRFRDTYIHDADLLPRLSRLFLFDLYVWDRKHGISPQEVMVAVKELEGGKSSATKHPTAFKHAPLGGLWHKHFFCARFIPKNILNGFGKNGLMKLVEEVMDPALSPTITRAMIDELAYRVANELLEKRQEANALTGEWIIYLPREGENYYLSLSAHDIPDQVLFDRILEAARYDFPQIESWKLQAAAGVHEG